MCQTIDPKTGRCLDQVQTIGSIGIKPPAVNSLNDLLAPKVQTTVPTQQTSTQGQGKFFTALNNLMPLIQTGAQTATQLNTNKTQREIAQRQAEAAAWQAQASLAQQGLNPYAPQQKSNNTWLIVAGVAVVAIILVVVLMKK
jgi:hypothetical protein